MEHFDITEWSDQVRGLARPEMNSLMQSHLESGCEKCDEVVGFLREVANTAAADLEMSPPEHAVRGAKASFAAIWPRSRSMLEVIETEIFFDSAVDPVPVGARSLDTHSRHVLCRSDEYYVDCKMDYERESQRVTLVGQVLHGEGALQEIPVFLISDDRVVVSGTNRFGEFESTCHRTPVTLRIMVGDGRCLELRVDLRQVGDDGSYSSADAGPEQDLSSADPTDPEDGR
jgi:hypothetical protein